jgi:hypothetical protein
MTTPSIPTNRLLFCLLPFAICLSSLAQQPNLILIIADDMAAEDCTPYGHPSIKTPGLARRTPGQSRKVANGGRFA